MAKLAARIRSASAPSLGGCDPIVPALDGTPALHHGPDPGRPPLDEWRRRSLDCIDRHRRALEPGHPAPFRGNLGLHQHCQLTGTGLDPYRSLAVDDRGGEHRSPTPGDGDTKLIPTDPEIRGERSRPDAGLLERARGADDERRCQRHIVNSAARSADRGRCETSSRAPPEPRRRRASTPVAIWLADACAVTTTPGSTGSPDRRPLASQAALAPASAGSAARSSSRSMTRGVIAPLGVRQPPYPLLRSGALPPYGGTERKRAHHWEICLPHTRCSAAGPFPPGGR